MNQEDAVRELYKILDTLQGVEKYLSKQNESNAALHCSTEVLYSPLTMKVKTSKITVEGMINRLSRDGTE